jgi:hypothetical protein
MRGAIPPFSNVFMAWCLVKHRDNFTFTFHQRRELIAMFQTNVSCVCMGKMRNAYKILVKLGADGKKC